MDGATAQGGFVARFFVFKMRCLRGKGRAEGVVCLCFGAGGVGFDGRVWHV